MASIAVCCIALGVLLVYAPALVLVVSSRHTLLGVWAAKAGLNAWRCAAALFRIHCQLWPTWAIAPAPSARSTAPLNADRVDAMRPADPDADFVPVD